MINLEVNTNNIELIAELQTFIYEYNIRGHLEKKNDKLIFVVDEIIKK